MIESHFWRPKNSPFGGAEKSPLGLGKGRFSAHESDFRSFKNKIKNKTHVLT